MVYAQSMKRICAMFAILAPLCTPVSAMADAPTPLGPNHGKFGTWTAATYGDGTAKICYAFTKPLVSKPNWKSRSLVMLTVTERPGVRDEVTITPGYTYPKAAKVSLAVGKLSIPFYVQDGTAFTDDGAKALAAFVKADTASANSSAPKSGGPKSKTPVLDEFSLTGFSAAYHAIEHACP